MIKRLVIRFFASRSVLAFSRHSPRRFAAETVCALVAATANISVLVAMRRAYDIMAVAGDRGTGGSEADRTATSGEWRRIGTHGYLPSTARRAGTGVPRRGSVNADQSRSVVAFPAGRDVEPRCKASAGQSRPNQTYGYLPSTVWRAETGISGHFASTETRPDPLPPLTCQPALLTPSSVAQRQPTNPETRGYLPSEARGGSLKRHRAVWNEQKPRIAIINPTMTIS